MRGVKTYVIGPLPAERPDPLTILEGSLDAYRAWLADEADMDVWRQIEGLCRAFREAAELLDWDAAVEIHTALIDATREAIRELGGVSHAPSTADGKDE